MRRFVWFALCAGWLLLSAGAAARAQTLSPEAFTRDFAKALAAAVPAATIEPQGKLELSVRHPGGYSATVSLQNAYASYTAEPSRFADLVRAFGATLSRRASSPAPAAAKLDPAHIMPVIKDRQWLADLQASLKARGIARPPEFAVEDFNADLIVVYAADDAHRMRYLTVAEIPAERQKWRELAVANLLRERPNIQLRSNAKLSLVTAGGDYDASLLLIDQIWSSGQIKVDGDIVVAVPARDLLFVTGSRNAEGLKEMRAEIARAIQGPHRLTPALFVYRNGRFEKFEGR